MIENKFTFLSNFLEISIDVSPLKQGLICQVTLSKNSINSKSSRLLCIESKIDF